MMNLLWSLGCWPISTSKASQICTNLNSDAKRKKCTEMKIFKKLPLPRLKWWNLAEKWWTSYKVQSVDPFPIEKLHQFERIWILVQKKKRAPKETFLKVTILQAETIKVGRTTMILWRCPSRWPISNRKVALSCLKLNSSDKKKRPLKQKFS